MKFFFRKDHRIYQFFFCFTLIFKNLIRIIKARLKIIIRFYIYYYYQNLNFIISDLTFYQIHVYYGNFHFKQDFKIKVKLIVKFHFLIPFQVQAQLYFFCKNHSFLHILYFEYFNQNSFHLLLLCFKILFLMIYFNCYQNYFKVRFYLNFDFLSYFNIYYSFITNSLLFQITLIFNYMIIQGLIINQHQLMINFLNSIPRYFIDHYDWYFHYPYIIFFYYPFYYYLFTFKLNLNFTFVNYSKNILIIRLIIYFYLCFQQLYDYIPNIHLIILYVL